MDQKTRGSKELDVGSRAQRGRNKGVQGLGEQREVGRQ